MPLPSRRAAILVALGFAIAAPAGAHEYWLAPSRYWASAGDTVAVGAIVGTGFRGEAKPFATRRAVKFTLSAARVLSLTPAAMNGGIPWASFVTPDGEGTLVAYQSDFADIELPAQEFED